MVIDTSVLMAIFFDEPEAEYFEAALESDSIRLMSTASVLEAMIVVEARLGEAGSRELDLLMHKAQITSVAFSPEQVETARHAFRTYGKRRHPAGLNFGDCFSYALSKTSAEALLFKGNDFTQTDIEQWKPVPNETD